MAAYAQSFGLVILRADSQVEISKGCTRKGKKTSLPVAFLLLILSLFRCVLTIGRVTHFSLYHVRERNDT